MDSNLNKLVDEINAHLLRTKSGYEMIEFTDKAEIVYKPVDVTTTDKTVFDLMVNSKQNAVMAIHLPTQVIMVPLSPEARTVARKLYAIRIQELTRIHCPPQ